MNRILSAIGMFRQPSSEGVNFAVMVRKRLAALSHWVGKDKLRYFAAVIVFFILLDQLFGYLSHGVLGWSRQSWSHSVFLAVFMALGLMIYRERWIDKPTTVPRAVSTSVIGIYRHLTCKLLAKP